MSAVPAAQAAGKTVAIMQPTFLPWIGYFALIDRVDLFVFLDDVQFDKRSWQQRNRILTAQGPLWLTVPVLTKGRRDQTIAEVQISPDPKFPASLLRTVESAYGKAPHFSRVFPDFAAILESHDGQLCTLNLALINWLASAFGIETPVVRSSGTPVASAKADRLAELCLAHGATRYLSPPGSKAYLDESNAFAQAGIDLAYFEYEHPTYGQSDKAFQPYMSALDLLLHAGPDSLAILRSGVKT
ncbi:WbqC family protein [Hyphobacterium marinum]|uniref:WbqC family protein n=1 Tax=Hyphobacterium marinum TaxID=3116574 RepID=A0ABU7LZT0_9PROT|nr:WbqC family protein [Hyphobacterium sp. Y6023]MEE2567035.1 WbqC family protein [Hyphobacterium sp. Y6023]